MEELKKIQHRRYMKQVWLPKFFRHHARKITDKDIICQYLKENFFVYPTNNISDVPWIYRYRTFLTQDNLFKPVVSTSDPDHDMDIAPDMDKQYMSDYVRDDELEKIKRMSSDAMNEWENHTINETISRSMEGNIDDVDSILLQQAIIESMKNKENTEDDDVEMEDRRILVNIDLRIYGRDPSQPIYVDDIPMYLNKQQAEEVVQKWHLVGPNATGAYIQDLEYVYASGVDEK